MFEEKLFKKVISRLKKESISYMLTGGLAVSVWGRPRSTLDIDIVIDLKEKDKSKVIKIFKKDFYIDEKTVDLALSKSFFFNIIDFESNVKVDFYLLKQNDYEKIKFKRRRRRKILGMNIDIISPEDLVLIKLKWHKESDSSRHLEDTESILKIQKKLDWAYLKKWAEIHSTIKILESLKKKIL